MATCMWLILMLIFCLSCTRWGWWGRWCCCSCMWACMLLRSDVYWLSCSMSEFQSITFLVLQFKFDFGKLNDRSLLYIQEVFNHHSFEMCKNQKHTRIQQNYCLHLSFISYNQLLFIFILYLSINTSMKESRIQSQTLVSCFLCCGGSEQEKSTIINHHNFSSASLKSDFKKLSLKKIHHQKFNPMQIYTPRQPINHNNLSLQSARFHPARHQNAQQPLYQTNQILSFMPNQMWQTQLQHNEYVQLPNSYSVPQRLIINNPTKTIVEFKIYQASSKQLYQTTKYEHQKPLSSDLLIKTRKVNQNPRPISNLTEIKRSFCQSQIESQEQKERLEESQILVNFFNPNHSQIVQMENYLKIKAVKNIQGNK